MVVNKDIKTIADLKGKRIGIQSPAASPTCWRAACLVLPISTPKRSTSSASPRKTCALVAGQIDTAILHVEQEIIAQQKMSTLHAIARLWRSSGHLQRACRDGEAIVPGGGQSGCQGHIESTWLTTLTAPRGAADHRQVHQAVESRRFHGAEVHLGRQPRPTPKRVNTAGVDGACRQYPEGPDPEVRGHGRSFVRDGVDQRAR